MVAFASWMSPRGFYAGQSVGRSWSRVLFLAWLMVADAGAEDWPMFRGPTGQGLSAETNVPVAWNRESNVVWRTELAGGGWSSPIVVGQRVFVTTAIEDGASLRVLCLDRADGRLLWDRQALRQEPTRKEGRNSFATATPAADAERVYALSFNGHLAALDPDGRPVWTNATVRFYSQHGLGTSPVLYEDLVIVAFDGSSGGDDPQLGWKKPWDQAVVLAVDKRTGQTRWRGQRAASRIGHATPVIWRRDGEALLLSPAGDVVQAFALKTGERLWSAFGQGEGVVPSPVVAHDLAFYTTGFERPHIRAVRWGGKDDVTATHVAWQSNKGVPMVTSLLYVTPYLYAITDGGVATCFRGETGEILWQERIGGNHSASPVAAGGHIYFLAEDGTTTVIEEGPLFRVVARNQLKEKCLASLAISGGRVFLRGETHLYCLGDAAAGEAESAARKPEPES